MYFSNIFIGGMTKELDIIFYISPMKDGDRQNKGKAKIPVMRIQIITPL